MDTKDWAMLAEFDITRVNDNHVVFYHAKCNTSVTVFIDPKVGMTLSTLVKYATRHKGQECNRLNTIPPTKTTISYLK